MPESAPSPAPPFGFLFLADHPAIDWVNTRYAPQGELIDTLGSWSDVALWLENAGLIPASEVALPSGKVSKQAWEEAVNLRNSWSDQVARMTGGGDPSPRFIAALNEILSRETFVETLSAGGSQSGGLTLVRSSSPSLKAADRALTLIARQIAGFLAESQPEYLRQCAAHDCVLYFYDTTRNHRRQWCSAATCGNRHKVAAFRERQARRSDAGGS